jgi:DNA ligase-1
MRVVVFDLPEHGGTTQERQAALGELTLPRTAFIAGHTVVRDEAHLLTLLDRVQSQQGEGLMLRRPGARYVAGRSMDVVKVKYSR